MIRRDLEKEGSSYVPSEPDDHCPRCYGDVDPRATVCPHCKRRLKAGVWYHIGTLVAALGLLMAIGGLIAGSLSTIGFGILLMVIGYGVRRD